MYHRLKNCLREEMSSDICTEIFFYSSILNITGKILINVNAYINYIFIILF